jgi:misacylated tRNA(Ala) deacylase
MSEKKNYYAPMHTAEHILNRTMVNLFGCERSENCHIERKKSKCDFTLENAPSEEAIRLLEETVKAVINKHHEITEKILNFDEAAKTFNLKRIKKEENPQVRIISIGDYDDCPCIGEHVKNTKELSDFRITTTSYDEETKKFRVRFKA